jgi:hypothetical protein
VLCPALFFALVFAGRRWGYLTSFRDAGDTHTCHLAAKAMHQAQGFIHAGVGHLHDAVRTADEIIACKTGDINSHLPVIAGTGVASTCRNLHGNESKEEVYGSCSVDWGDTGDAASFSVDLLLVLKKFIEGNKPNPIAALVEPVIVESTDFHPEGASFFTGAHALAGHSIGRQSPEGASFGVGADHRQRHLGMHRWIESRLVFGEITFDGSRRSTGELQHVGKLQALLTGGIVPSVQIRNCLFAEAILIFDAIDVGINFSVVTLLLQDCEMVKHLRLVLRGAAQQMLKVELDKPIGIAIGKEAIFVEAAFGNLTHKFANAQISPSEKRFRSIQPLACHHILASKNLLIDRADQIGLVDIRAGRPVGFVAIIGEARDAQIGSVGKGHWEACVEGREGEGENAVDPSGCIWGGVWSETELRFAISPSS